MKIKIIIALLSLLTLSLPINAAKHTKHASVPAKLSQENSKINLNKTDAMHLVNSFKGIGKKRANAIIAYREHHGLYKSVKDLVHVKGFSQSFIDKHIVKLNEIFTAE